MAKKSQLAAAISSIEEDIAVLQAALARLKQQQTKAPVRKPRAVPAKDEKVSA